jgi:hypothetical protein
MGDINSHNILVGKLKSRDHFGNLGVDVRIILKWILKKCYMTLWIGVMWLRIGSGCRLL